MIGWYFDIVVGFIIRTVVRFVKIRSSETWPVEKGTISSATCPLAPNVQHVVFVEVARLQARRLLDAPSERSHKYLRRKKNEQMALHRTLPTDRPKA
jgi:hypothetical protein